MSNKTNAQLEAEIAELRLQLDSQTKAEKYDDAAVDIYNMYQSFIKAGFSKEQAWELVKTITNNGTTRKSIF